MTFCTHQMRQSMQNAISYSCKKSTLCPIVPVYVVVSPVVVPTVSA